MVQKEISNIAEYVQVIDELSKQCKRDVVRDDTILFRGHPDNTFELLPSLARKVNWMENSLVAHENELITKAMGKNPNIFYEEKYGINLLVKLQHFGIPTRLLDVTYNSLVALYFACIKEEDKDGEVIVFLIASDKGDYVQYYNDRAVDIISKTYQRKIHYPYDVYSFLDSIDYTPVDSSDEEEVDTVLGGNLSSVIETIDSPIFVSPAELSERQKRQQGAFIIFPNWINNIMGKIYVMPEITALENDDRRIIARIKIPADAKKELLEKLEFFGITEEFLFPDSTDIICKTIKDNILKRLGR